LAIRGIVKLVSTCRPGTVTGKHILDLLKTIKYNEFCDEERDVNIISVHSDSSSENDEQIVCKYT